MSCTADTHCITCSDEGLPMRVVELLPAGLARCDAEGAESDVMVDLIAPVSIGDDVLVHAGVALARLA